MADGGSGGGSTVLMLTRRGMGHGTPNLMRTLISRYLTILLEDATLPEAICFYTEGVFLVAEGSPVLEQLRALEARGVHLIACKTCLDHYELADEVKVGIVGGMGDIVAAQMKAAKVITL
jgi:intracellular sulfur oxidation DsrE/DsrF family protein